MKDIMLPNRRHGVMEDLRTCMGLFIEPLREQNAMLYLLAATVTASDASSSFKALLMAVTLFDVRLNLQEATKH